MSSTTSVADAPLQFLSFARCKLDLSTRELRVDDELIDIQPLVFDLLVYFARHPRRVIGRDELLNGVWGSTFVTESVVSRAVMKARRAIMDDARHPQLLLTVPRAGYRLAVQPIGSIPTPNLELDELARQAPLHSAVDLVVLPLWSSDPLVATAGSRLAGLMHHFLEREATLVLLPMPEVHANWDTLQRDPDILEAACRLFAAREALCWNWRQASTGGWQLVLHRGTGQHQVREWVLDGDELWAQAWRAIQTQLTPTSDIRALAPPREALQTLGEALYLDQTGANAMALPRLREALLLWPGSGWLSLCHALLCQRAGQPAEAVQVAAQALQTVEVRQHRVLHARLLGVQGLSQEVSDDVDGANASLAQAIALTANLRALACHRVDMLGWYAAALVRSGQGERALLLTGQAVIEGSAVGVTSSLAAAKLMRCNVLVFLQQVDRALNVMNQAVELATATRIRHLLARVTLAKGVLLSQARRFREAAQVCDAALELATNPDAPRIANLSRLEHMTALLESDQLDLAEIHWLLFKALHPGSHAYKGQFGYVSAILDWKQGRECAAIAHLQRLTHGPDARPILARRYLHHLLANMLLCLGKRDEARLILPQMQDDPVRERLLYTQAHLAFVEGRRKDCIDGLRTIWGTIRSLSQEVMDAGIDLAWLLLEDSDAAQPNQELESLVAHFLEYSDSYMPSLLLTAAYLLKGMPSAGSQARWEAAVQQARTFARRCPPLATPAYRDALAHGQPPRAPRLLTQLCQ